jgi:type IV secretory pathway TrbD component
MTKILNLIAGLIAAAIGFVILYPILGVALWVSFLVAACLLVVISASSTRVTAH